MTTKRITPQTPAEALASRGFTLESTGGNCTAYIKEDDTVGEILVTYEDDASAPDKMSDPVEVGFYGLQHSEPLLTLHFPTLTAFIKTLREE